MPVYTGFFFTATSNPGLARRMFEFRTRLFVNELGWSLPMEGGLERDQFDTPSAVYCALTAGNEFVGCFRAIWCDRPYLAKTVFPHLATAKSYPNSPDAIEISRLGVSPERPAASALIYSLMVRFAVNNDASRLVAIVETSHERLLNKIGLKTVRYGDCHIVGFRDDGAWILGVAGEIPILGEKSTRLHGLIQLTQKMEIHDETEIFGRERLSA